MPSFISVTKFVAQKIRKIRWCPPPKESLNASNLFATGSWDETENKICLWLCGDTKDAEPKLIYEINHQGDVSELKFLNHESFVASSSLGSVALYRQVDQTFTLSQEWSKIHKYNVEEYRSACPCTCIDVEGDEVVSVGADERIIQLNVNHPNAVRVLEGTDICAINSVLFLRKSHALTANMRGQLKVWDLRSKSSQPVQKFVASGDYVGMHCLSQHPHQPQIIASGGEDGTLYIWDTRHEKFPVSLLSAHSSTMLEVKFHPHNPNHLFTCSQDGSIWHWDCSSINQTSSMQLFLPKIKTTEVTSESNPWLACGAIKHRLDICSLLPMSILPINSLDIDESTLICGSDNEAIYLIQNVIKT